MQRSNPRVQNLAHGRSNRLSTSPPSHPLNLNMSASGSSGLGGWSSLISPGAEWIEPNYDQILKSVAAGQSPYLVIINIVRNLYHPTVPAGFTGQLYFLLGLFAMCVLLYLLATVADAPALPDTRSLWFLDSPFASPKGDYGSSLGSTEPSSCRTPRPCTRFAPPSTPLVRREESSVQTSADPSLQSASSSSSPRSTSREEAICQDGTKECGRPGSAASGLALTSRFGRRCADGTSARKAPSTRSHASRRCSPSSSPSPFSSSPGSRLSSFSTSPSTPTTTLSSSLERSSTCSRSGRRRGRLPKASKSTSWRCSSHLGRSSVTTSQKART